MVVSLKFQIINVHFNEDILDRRRQVQIKKMKLTKKKLKIVNKL